MMDGIFRPRVETRYWIKKAVSITDDKVKVLDVFAGSGFIGLQFLEKENSVVHFVDCSKRAVELIKEKTKGFGDRVKVLQGDIFKPIDSRYDIIVANPPYVAESRRGEVDEETLENDPEGALFSGKDGMDSIRVFLKEVGGYLKKDGMFFMEFDPQQKGEIGDILERDGWEFSFKKDQFDKTRWVVASLDESVSS